MTPMTQLPSDFDHGEMEPETRAIVRRMEARFKVTGQVNPPVNSPEARSKDRGWWREFWDAVAVKLGR